MAYVFGSEKVDALFSKLKSDYRIFAPKRFLNQGRFSDTDIIRYAEVDSFSEIVFTEKSDYPAKEVISPIQQALFYFALLTAYSIFTLIFVEALRKRIRK